MIKKVYNMCCEGRKSMEKVIENSKNKMLKSCSILRKGLTVIEVVIVLMIFFSAIFGMITDINSTQNENNNVDLEYNEMMNEEDEESALLMLIDIASVIATFVIISNIKSMLRNIEDKKTPFNEYSIKVLKKISIILLVIAIINLSIINFAFYLSMLSLYSCFKYGYYLQQEEDNLV